MIPINVINIVEVCNEGSISFLYDYGKLPQNVKNKVDEALLSEDKTIECDIYKDGIQFLLKTNHPTLLENKVLVMVFLGTVYFYDIY